MTPEPFPPDPGSHQPDGPTSGSYAQSYGQPPPGYGGPGGPGAVPETNRLALASLVVGLVGTVPCCWSVPVLAVAAVVLGVLGRRQVRASQGRQKGHGMAVAGIVLGVVVVLLGIAYWVLVATGVIDTSVYVRR